MTGLKNPISKDPEVLSGAPCFSGTRVPVAALMDYLEAGDRVDDFPDDFPTVTRPQVSAVLRIASEDSSDPNRPS